MRFIRKTAEIVLTLLLIPIFIIEIPFFLLSSFLVACGIRKASIIENLLGRFNDWYVNIDFKKTKKQRIVEPEKQITTKIDPRSQDLKSLPNEISGVKNIFDNDSYVFYYEPSYNSLINEYLTDHYFEIKNSLDDKGIKFIYPQLLTSAPLDQLNELLDYYFPYVQIDDFDKKALGKNLHSVSFFANLLGISGVDRPCFIRNIYDRDKREIVYKVFYLPNNDKELLDQSVSFYVSVVRESISSVQRSVGNRNIQFSIIEPDENDPDYAFEKETDKLSASLREEINEELIKNKTKGAMRMMLFLLKQMKEYHVPADEQVKQFIESLQAKSSLKPSPIIVTNSGKLILSDYNKEIKLEPIHRAVYIFFLLRKEGIMFKDLPSYKNDLLNIYSKLSNRSSLEVMEKTIDDLVNPFSNAMNEKCSRIKLAFLKAMDERIAQYYVIDGDRNQNKRIILDRSLVTFEDNIY